MGKPKSEREQKNTPAALFGAAWRKIKDFFYDISSKLHEKFGRKREGSIAASKRSKSIFIAAVFAYPVLVFTVFYLYVNINSVLLSLKQFNMDTGKYEFWGFGNFKKFLLDLKHLESLRAATKNSFLLYGINLIIGMPLHIMCSYFIYKKIPMSGLFKVMLFLPNLLSTVVMTIMYKYFVDIGLTKVLEMLSVGRVPDFFQDSQYALPTVIFYNLWFGMGGGIILYTGTMSRIPDSLVESASLEGITTWKEFWYITVPLIYPTITVFLVTGIAGIFTNQANLYTFHGSNARPDTYTFGYFLFIKVVKEASIIDYPYASAAGLLFTLIVVPITLIARHFLEKYGPSADY